MQKKMLSLALILTLMMLTLTGCGKFTCDLCGEEKSGKSYTASVLGEEVTICKDCKTELDELKNELFGN